MKNIILSFTFILITFAVDAQELAIENLSKHLIKKIKS